MTPLTHVTCTRLADESHAHVVVAVTHVTRGTGITAGTARSGTDEISHVTAARSHVTGNENEIVNVIGSEIE